MADSAAPNPPPSPFSFLLPGVLLGTSVLCIFVWPYLFGDTDLSDWAALPAGLLLGLASGAAIWRWRTVTVWHELMERDQAKSALKASEDRFQLVVTGSYDGIWDWDVARKTVYWSPRFKELLGYAPEELEATDKAFAERMHPEDYQRLLIAVDVHLRERTPFDIEYRLKCRDGTYRWYRSRGKACWDENGNPLRMTGSLTDIMALKESQAALEKAKEEAEAANRAKSEFLANMSHELRTPLNALLGFAGLLEQPGRDWAQNAQTVVAIRRNGQQLLRIINNLLDLTSIEAGKISLEKTTCSPWQLVLDVFPIISAQAQEKGLILDAEPRGALPARIRTDAARVHQILLNLASNAVKFTPAGRVRLSVAQVTLEGQGNNRLLFNVEDEGPGLTPAEQAQLFTAFYQVDSSPTRPHGGAGLGLSISRGLARALGGDLLVQSEPGRGSCFTLCLPLDAADHIEQVPPAKPEGTDITTANGTLPRPMRHGKVLLVEDIADIQDLVRAFLQGAGLELMVVNNGQEAVNKALREPVDVILMDMQMPILDGYAATRALRAHGYEGTILAFTAHATAGEREKCMEAGCNDYLTKPENWNDLLRGLDPWLPARETEADLAAPYPDSKLLLRNNPALRRMLNEFLGELPGRMAELRLAQAKEDLGELGRRAHAMKGTSLMYGCREIGETAGLLESAVREGQDGDLIEGLMAELEELIAATPARKNSAGEDLAVAKPTP